MASSGKRARPLSMEHVDPFDALITKILRIDAADTAEAASTASYQAVNLPINDDIASVSGKEVTSVPKTLAVLPERLNLYHVVKCPAIVNIYGKQPKPDQISTFEETYHELLKWQAAHPDAASPHLDLYAESFSWSNCAELFGDVPYPIDILDVKADAHVKLKKEERQYPCNEGAKTAKGWTTKLAMNDDSRIGDSGKGMIKIQQAWTGKEGKGLYECWVEIKVK